jgi:integrase
MSGESIALAIKEACARVGLDAVRYSGHSLRAGCATAASANGASDRAIMSRWPPQLEMVGRYIRHGSLFAVNPAAGRV